MSTPVGPYTPVVRAGPFVVCSGQVGLANGESGAGARRRWPRCRRPARRWRTSRRCSASSGLGWPDVFKTTVYLTDISAYSDFNANLHGGARLSPSGEDPRRGHCAADQVPSSRSRPGHLAHV